MKGKITLFFALLLFTQSIRAQTGIISGKVIDAKSGETLIGASVIVDDSPTMGAATDLDGNFTIPKVPTGKHSLKVNYIGYQPKVEQNVEVRANEVTNLNLTLAEDAVNLKEAVVTATVTKRDNESAVVVMQKNSTVIQSGISAEEIKRSPDRSSGDVIKRVSGATIQDGKFAVIRGLADRYNMALLNNVVLPSTEPDRKAFAFDVFPSNILDNIIIMKTGQPNLPSEWSGGLIQLNSRDIPEKNFFNVSYGISFTEQTTFLPFKTYEGSKTDALGFDSKVRTLPGSFPGIVALNDLKLASKNDSLNRLGRQLMNGKWGVKETMIAYPGQNIQMSGGFAVRKERVQVGGVLGLSYNNTLRFAEGERSRYDGADKEYYFNYDDKRYTNLVNAALLGNLGVVIENNHKLVWKNVYTINSENTVYDRQGVNYFNAAEQKRTNLEFISSRVLSSNLGGDHFFKGPDIRWKWNGGVVLINRSQPRSVRYSYERPYSSAGQGMPNTVTDPYQYIIQVGGSDPKLSAMFHSYLKERVYNGSTDLTIPFQVKSQKQSISVGYYYQHRQRSFEARNLFVDGTSFSVQIDSMMYDPDVNNIINQQNFDNGKLTLNQVAFPEDMYTARATTHAAYMMMENNFGEKFKMVWGFRFEQFTQKLTSPTNIDFDIIPNDPEPPLIKTKLTDSTYVQSYFSGAYSTDSLGKVKTVFPLLPSVNLIYKLNENMNIRASYSQSMGRPEFREVSPFIYYDFLRDVNLIGNVNLRQTFVHNADLRYEWFMGKGQSMNVSVFYKNFKNTIELTTLSAGGVPQFIYNNAPRADLVGAEVELRKNFGFVHSKLEDLVFSANLAYIYSLVNLKNVKNNASDELIRPMQGQSPYIVNLSLSYVHPKIGTGASLLYNMSGHRLYAVGETGNPAWYEHYRPLLDLQISQKFWKDRGLIRFTVSDLIARSSIFYQNDEVGKARQYQKGKDYTVLSQKNYRTYSVNISFNF